MNPLPMLKTAVPIERLNSDNSSFSKVSNKLALEGILGVPNAAIYRIITDSLVDTLQNMQEDVTEIITNLRENTIFVWENTVPLNTIKLLDVLSEIQLNSKTASNFTFTHKCYKESSVWSSLTAPIKNDLTCVFTIKPKPSDNLKSFSTFRRLAEETENLNSSNTTKPSSPKNTTKPGAETKPSQNLGHENKPPKTEITTVQAKSSFQSIVLLLIVGLAIAALVVALVKYRKKLKIKRILASGGSRLKKIDVQKLIIKPSFLNLNHQQGESGIGSMSSGKGKRTLFLSDTNYAMSPVIDVKTIHHLNLEENHRSSMIPEEVILTNIDDSQESKESSKTSVDASPQDLGFNIEFSMLEVQESSKFQSKNLKSEE